MDWLLQGWFQHTSIESNQESKIMLQNSTLSISIQQDIMMEGVNTYVNLVPIVSHSYIVIDSMFIQVGKDGHVRYPFSMTRTFSILIFFGTRMKRRWGWSIWSHRLDSHHCIVWGAKNLPGSLFREEWKWSKGQVRGNMEGGAGWEGKEREGGEGERRCAEWWLTGMTQSYHDTSNVKESKNERNITSLPVLFHFLSLSLPSLSLSLSSLSFFSFFLLFLSSLSSTSELLFNHISTVNQKYSLTRMGTVWHLVDTRCKTIEARANSESKGIGREKKVERKSIPDLRLWHDVHEPFPSIPILFHLLLYFFFFFFLSSLFRVWDQKMMRILKKINLRLIRK